MKKLLIGVLILLIILILIITLVYAYELDRGKLRTSPSLLTSYSARGYYLIDPETILAKLEQGQIDVFTPLIDDPDTLEPLNNVPYSWTQANFLEVASALGQMVWDDPMDLNDWSVYFIFFAGSCQDDPMGFDDATITYFKTVERHGKKVYTTRVIDIELDYNMVVWGGGATFPRSILNLWKSVDLSEAKITADAALRIAEENGSIQSDTICAVYISSPYSNNDGKWHLSESGFEMYIDMDTGEYEVLNTDQ